MQSQEKRGTWTKRDTVRQKLTARRKKKREKTISEPTEGFRQQVLDELSMIPDMQHAVDTGVHQLLLVVAQVLGHVLWHEHNVTLHVHHKEEAIQSLED